VTGRLHKKRRRSEKKTSKRRNERRKTKEDRKEKSPKFFPRKNRHDRSRGPPYAICCFCRHLNQQDRFTNKCTHTHTHTHTHTRWQEKRGIKKEKEDTQAAGSQVKQHQMKKRKERQKEGKNNDDERGGKRTTHLCSPASRLDFRQHVHTVLTPRKKLPESMQLSLVRPSSYPMP